MQTETQKIAEFISELKTSYVSRTIRGVKSAIRRMETNLERDESLDKKMDRIQDVFILGMNMCFGEFFDEDEFTGYKTDSLDEFLEHLRNYENFFLSPNELKLKQLQEDYYPHMRESCQLYDELPNFEKPERVCVVGDIQLGKTRMQVQAMVKSILHGHECIFIAGNLLDQRTQAMDGVNRIRDELADMKEQNQLDNNINIQVCDISCAESWLTGKKYNILVLVATGIQLKKLLKLATNENENEPFKNTPFDLYVDEADKCLTSKASKGAEVSFEPMLKKLTEYSYNVVYTTATPMGVLFLEDIRVFANKVLQMEKPEHYIGFDKLQKHFLDEEKKSGKDVLSLKTSNNIFDIDIYLALTLKIFSKLMPFQEAIEDPQSSVLPRLYHPRIFLIKNSIYKKHHHDIKNHIIQKYPKHFFTIIYDQNSVFHFHNLTKHKYIIGNSSFIRQPNRCYSMSGHVHIKELITFALQQKPDRIAIISGNLASRGINFVSKNFKYHITDQYLQPSDAMDMETLVQALRILGLQDPNDNTPRSLWMTEKNFTDLSRYCYSREKVIEILEKSGKFVKTRDHTVERITPKVYNSLKGKTIAAENWPGRRFSKTRTILRRVKNKNEEWSSNIDRKEFIGGGDNKENEFNRLRLMFPRWSHMDNITKIASFMRELDPRKMYLENEIKEYCGIKNINLCQLMNINIGNSHGFGTIIKKNDNNTYQLYPELVQSFELYFNA